MKDSDQPASLVRRAWLIKPYLFGSKCWRSVTAFCLLMFDSHLLMFDSHLFCLYLRSPWASLRVSRSSRGLLCVKELDCQAVFLPFFKVVIPVCAPAPSLCLDLCKEAFVAGVGLCVCVCPCVEGVGTTGAHSMSCVLTSHVEDSEIVGFAHSHWSVGAGIPDFLLQPWLGCRRKVITQKFHVCFLFDERDAIDCVGPLHLAPGPIPAGLCLPAAGWCWR